MKEGDKLYCKKTYISNDEYGIEEWVTEGKQYKVIYDKYADVYSIIDNDGDFNSTLTIQYILEKHFYTASEYRKLKLKKIYESNLCYF
jgi:hypothetical protein